MPYFSSPQWICCQLGAREHYAIPRALQDAGRLKCLITDAWVPPGSLASRLPDANIRGRFHADLTESSIHHFTTDLIRFELIQKLKRRSQWDSIITRNGWFQNQALTQLKRLAPKLSQLDTPPTVFAYSYAALEILRYAKAQNWMTVLGQIDPGKVEEEIVSDLSKEAGSSRGSWQPAPPSYWQNWQQECDVADCILVNSEWSRQALTQSGVVADKVEVVPLAYQPPENFLTFHRTYPNVFTAERPLRLLFLGQVNLRKGIFPLLQALDELKEAPIILEIVGPTQVTVPKAWLSHPNVHWVGGVARSQAADYYRQADLFILPTYSDGFALTQLEAVAWNLPLVVSACCGQVVEQGVNGVILQTIDSASIASALKKCLDNPQMLSTMSSQAKLSDFTLKKLRERMENISIEKLSSGCFNETG